MANNSLPNSAILQRARAIPEIPTPMFSRPPSRLLRAGTTYSIPLYEPAERSQTVPQVQSDQTGRPRGWTQEDQDNTDAETRKKAMKELVQSWMDRLQLISVITTFFAATEAQILGITTPGAGDEDHNQTRTEQSANAALAGALVTHVFAAILSFFAAFFLVRYRLKEATREERKVEEGHANGSEGIHIFSTNPHLEPFGPFRRGQPPTHLLENCHTLCMWLSAVGFVLALAGVVCFTWALLPGSVSIFASTCMGVCLIGGGVAIRNAERSAPNPAIS
ncbi:hypothetical protein BXZ70DRAFT_533173 [Cristinia sonorae]|uniref:Transmembrane protein n=1 Tax=Cristinia sonorae TaxID=1940300 RepID=A0A8K0XL70_9AGAR|nr:hypothetical protein BXZ70DRAFT_533173 [Cristinia sonorae]